MTSEMRKVKQMKIDKRRLRKRAIWLSAIAAIVACALMLFGRSGSAAADGEPIHIVTRGPMEVTVIAPGAIRSRNSAIVKSEAQGRNTVIWVIDEGKVVTNGQLLVELDASDLEKSLTDQQIVVGNSEAAMAQAKERLAIAEIERESNISDANLRLMLAKLELEKYEKGEYPQALQEAESKIALTQEEVERATETLNWTRKLAESGFVTRSDLQADELSLKQKKAQQQSAVTAMNLLTNYTYRQEIAKLKADIDQAELSVDKIERQSGASVAQAKSELAAKEQEYNRQEDKRKNLVEQIAACRITAPTNGMVVYASTMQASRRRWGGDPLAAGATVVTRQDLIHIPVEGGLVVEFSTPESDMTKLELGQPADVVIDATPDVEVRGVVSKIGVLPDGQSAWLNPDMNLYNCEISITNTPSVPLRAGMNCTVNMLVATYEDVISIPLQCVMRSGGECFVFVAVGDGASEKRTVVLGQDNGRFVLVQEGLKPGDKVLLAPPLAAGEVASEK